MTPHEHVRGEQASELEVWDDERGRLTFRTVFSADTTGTDRMSTGTAYIQPGDRLAVHAHTATEIYLVVHGAGIVTLDGADVPVTVGDSVFIKSGTRHGIRNTGDAELRFHYVFDVASFDQVHYEFS